MKINKNRLPGINRLTSTTLASVLIFAFTLSIFLISRIRQVADSEYSMMLSQSLLDRGSFALEHYAIPRHEPVWHGDYFKNGPVYQMEVVNKHIYYHFPPGSSVLSVPYVALMNLFGISAVNADGTYSRRGEVMIEASLAALLMATLAVIFFYTSRLLLPVSWSVVVALGGALGTQVYSTASRALWSETWGILLLGIAIFLLLASETGKRRLNPVVLASLLSWMYFVRPTYAVHILAITIYMLVFHRRLFARYAVTGAVWLAAFVFYSRYHFGTLLPNYYRAGRLSFDVFWTALAGNLISPARGLLVYVPSLLFVVYLLVRYRRHLKLPRLVLLSLSIVVGQLLIISSFAHWWGGHSFGPRFTTGLVPWFVLLAILGVGALLRWREEQAPAFSLTGWRVQLGVGAALLVLSAFINTLGATSHAAWLWNQRPLDIDQHPERLWDWRQPQFLAGILPTPPPRDFPAGEGHVDFGKPEAERFMWYGWNRREEGLRWTDGKEATLVFASAQSGGDQLLRIKLGAFVIPGRNEQRVNIDLNGQRLQTLLLKEDAAREYDLRLPGNMLRSKNILTFGLPDAVSPKSLGQGDDTRPLAIAVYWIEFQHVPVVQ